MSKKVFAIVVLSIVLSVGCLFTPPKANAGAYVPLCRWENVPVSGYYDIFGNWITIFRTIQVCD